jgi:uncharacterized membrane protein YedE/YeeE
MLETLKHPWPWYVAGPLIGLMVPILLLIGNKQFGISSTLRDFCALIVPKRFEYFRYELKEHAWRNFLVIGILLGGTLTMWLLPGDKELKISAKTIDDLRSLGINDFSGLVPVELFSGTSLFSFRGFILIICGGFLIGFGTRWADGCTAGHAITGLSLLSSASLISVIGFFCGGLIATHFLLPLIV